MSKHTLRSRGVCNKRVESQFLESHRYNKWVSFTCVSEHFITSYDHIDADDGGMSLKFEASMGEVKQCCYATYQRSHSDWQQSLQIKFHNGNMEYDRVLMAASTQLKVEKPSNNIGSTIEQGRVYTRHDPAFEHRVDLSTNKYKLLPAA